MKLFGRELFTKRKEQFLYDFAQHGLINDRSALITINDINLSAVSGDDEISDQYMDGVKKHNKKKAEKPKITPKGLFELESLNNPNMQLKTDDKYLDKQIELIEKKILLMIKTNKGGGYESGAVRYGRDELESLIIRLNNRRKYESVQGFFEQYPYTLSETIKDTVEHYSNLRAERAEQFVPDLPEEAIQTMEGYTGMVKQLCGLKPVFYIIADRKDFEKTTQKRDPVLLAQSPFGLVWQVLGAWDDEMVLLEEL